MWYLDHVGVVASDLDRSVGFYSTILGRPPVERVVWAGKDAEYVAQMLDTPGLTLRCAFFELPFSKTILELVEYGGFPNAAPSGGDAPTTPGVAHFAFFIESMDEAAARLKSAGADFLSPPLDIPYGPYQGGRTAYFKDPDGLNLQLMEIGSRPGALSVLRSSQPVAAYVTE